MSKHPMTDKDNMFMFEMLQFIGHETVTSFTGGRAEHGGHIWQIHPIDLAKESRKEHLDGYTYTYTLEKILTEMFRFQDVQNRYQEVLRNLMR